MLYFQLLRHAWSDEWNFVYYYRAKDIRSLGHHQRELEKRVYPVCNLEQAFPRPDRHTSRPLFQPLS